MRQRFIFVLGLFALLAACSSPSSSSSGSAVSLGLKGIPADVNSYEAEVGYFDAQDQPLVLEDMGVVTASGNRFTVTPPAKAKSLSVYLFTANSPSGVTQDPLYIAGAILGSNTSYQFSYWLDYLLYFDTIPSQTRYGISNDSLETLSSLAQLSLNFDDAPYHLYRYDNTGGQYFTTDYTSTGSNLWIHLDANFSHLVNVESQGTFAFTGQPSGAVSATGSPLYLFLKPSDYTLTTTASLGFENVDQSSLTENLISLVPTEQPSLMYALGSAGGLYRINPLTEEVTKLTTLSLPSVTQLAYSSSANKVFCVSTSTAQYAEYDLSLGHENDVSVSSVSGAKGISLALDDMHHRLYVEIEDPSTCSVAIVDAQTRAGVTGSPFASPQLLNGAMAIDTASQTLYLIGAISLAKYSVAGDSISAALDVNSNPVKNNAFNNFYNIADYDPLKLTSDGSHLLVAMYGDFYWLETTNLTETSSWSSPLPYDGYHAILSNDGESFLTIPTDVVQQVRVSDKVVLKQFHVPAGNNGIYSLNSDGSVLVSGTGPASTDPHGIFFVNMAQSSSVAGPLENRVPFTGKRLPLLRPTHS